MERELLRGIPAEIATLIDDGYRRWREGQLDEAQLPLEAALSRAAERGNVAGLLSVRHLLGNVAYDRGELAEAQEHHLFVLAESESPSIAVGVASSLHNLGLVSARLGDLATGRQQLLAAAWRYERLGMDDAANRVRANLAAIEQGAPPQHGADDGQP